MISGKTYGTYAVVLVIHRPQVTLYWIYATTCVCSKLQKLCIYLRYCLQTGESDKNEKITKVY